MATTPVLQLRGTDDLLRKLRRVSDRATAEQVILDSLENGAERMRKKAASQAPVGTEPVARKRLREGIVKRKLSGRERVEFGFGWKIAPLREVAHGVIVEFGSPARGIPADPFMRRSFDSEKGAVIRDFKRAMIAEIRKATR